MSHPISLECGRNHDGLIKGLTGLADYMRRGVLDWKRLIGEIAQQPPPLSPEQTDLIDDALGDPIRTRFFVNAANDAAWVEWLDSRGHLDQLFAPNSGSEIDEPYQQLASWLARQIACEHPEALMRLIERKRLRIGHYLWWQLAIALGSTRDQTWDPDIVAKWISVLLDDDPSPTSQIDHALYELARAADRADLNESLVSVFDAMAQPNIPFRRHLDLGHWTINEVWEQLIRPRLDVIAERLIVALTERFRERHELLRVWEGGNRQFDSDTWRRCAIAPEENSLQEDALDVLINAARDCLIHLAEEKPAVADALIFQLIRFDSPLVRRIAIHGMEHHSKLTADQKIQWVITSFGLYDISCRPEIFRLLGKAYREASVAQRRRVLAAVADCPETDLSARGHEKNTAFRKLTWLDWLRRIAPDCADTNNALDDIRAEFPDVGIDQRPDLLFSSQGFEWVGAKSPWSAEELTGRRAGKWLPKLIEFDGHDPFGPTVEGLVQRVSEAATKDFGWGIDLADGLINGQHWATQLWSGLLEAWNADIRESQFRQVLARLCHSQICEFHSRSVARLLEALVKDGGRPYALGLLPIANAVACVLWPYTRKDFAVLEDHDWFTRAKNHAVGHLAEYWLTSLSIRLQAQQFERGSLPATHSFALDSIVQSETLARPMASSVLTSRFAFLLYADESWTRKNLLPLFSTSPERDDFQAAWDGLMFGQLTIPTAEVLDVPFLNAASNIRRFRHSGTRKGFVARFTALLIDCIEDPIERWVPAFFLESEEQDRQFFGSAIHGRLSEMPDLAQRELWDRWLRRYWENRIEGVPVPLNSQEAQWMLNWLPHLESLFVDGVEIALRTPLVQFDPQSLIHGLLESNHCESEPNAVADLLICAAGTDSANARYYRCDELIERLLGPHLTDARKRELQELRARAGLAG